MSSRVPNLAYWLTQIIQSPTTHYSDHFLACSKPPCQVEIFDNFAPLLPTINGELVESLIWIELLEIDTRCTKTLLKI
jgi:hypothetical protein